MSESIKEIENDIAALNAKLDRVKLLDGGFKLCDDGYTVFSSGDFGLSGNERYKNFASIYKTEKQAIKRRRMQYLQNVEFQLAEHFNEGEVCDWSDDSSEKHSIAFNHYTEKWFAICSYTEQILGVSYFISREAAEKALHYYIEAVEHYDRGEI